MIATGPPVKEKRGGDLAATTPKLRLLIDHTPLICSAQTCEHVSTRIERLCSGPHYAKEVCTDCDKVLRWLPRPETLERSAFNAFRLVKLAMCDQLSPRDRNFIHSVSQRKKVSPKQQQIIDRLCAQYLEPAK
jgi:hypothetical protein